PSALRETRIWLVCDASAKGASPAMTPAARSARNRPKRRPRVLAWAFVLVGTTSVISVGPWLLLHGGQLARWRGRRRDGFGCGRGREHRIGNSRVGGPMGGGFGH